MPLAGPELRSLHPGRYGLGTRCLHAGAASQPYPVEQSLTITWAGAHIGRVFHIILATMDTASGMVLVAPQVSVQMRLTVLGVGVDPFIPVNAGITAAAGESPGVDGEQTEHDG